MQKNETITSKVGYQSCFVDGAEVLQENLGAAEQNCFVDGADVLQKNVGCSRTQQ